MNVIRNKQDNISPEQIKPGPVEIPVETPIDTITETPLKKPINTPKIEKIKEKEEDIQEYNVNINYKHFICIKMNQTRLDKLYKELKATGDFIIIDENYQLIYIKQPTSVIIIKKLKVIPDQVIIPTKQKKWWKKNEKV